MTVEDGTGVPGADTYVDPTGAFAVAYVAGSLYTEAWAAASAPRRESAVIQASRTLDALYEWKGTPLSQTQGLAWPRIGIYVSGRLVPNLPDAIKAATLEMAMALLTKNRLSDTASGSAPVEQVGLGGGALTIKFGADPAVNTPTPASQMIPPYVRELLRPYGYTSIAGGMTRIERR